MDPSNSVQIKQVLTSHEDPSAASDPAAVYYDLDQSAAGFEEQIQIKEEVVLEQSQSEFDYSAGQDEATHEHSHDIEDSLPEDIEIKDEITIEESKIEDNSDLELKFHCKYCDFRCQGQRELTRHIATAHADIRLVRCNVCSCKFKGVKQLEEHIASQHDGVEIDCKVCHQPYSKGKLKSHKKECQGRLLFTCGLCQQSFVSKNGLMKHWDVHSLSEGEEKPPILETRSMEPILTCKFCTDDKAFRKDLLKNHIKHQHTGHHLRMQKQLEKRKRILLFKCLICESSYITRKGLLNHLNVHSSSEESQELSTCEIQANEEMFSCALCEDDKAFKKEPYWDHIKEQHNGHYLRCSYCSKTFKNREDQRLHKSACTSDPKHGKFIVINEKCPHCPRIMRTKYGMNIHIKKMHV